METLARAISIASPSTHVMISSLIVQKNVGHSIWISEFNARLYDLCVTYGYMYIDNRNIDITHLAEEDGLHLNQQGTVILAQNFISAIRNMDFYVCQGNRTVK